MVGGPTGAGSAHPEGAAVGQGTDMPWSCRTSFSGEPPATWVPLRAEKLGRADDPGLLGLAPVDPAGRAEECALAAAPPLAALIAIAPDAEDPGRALSATGRLEGPWLEPDDARTSRPSPRAATARQATSAASAAGSSRARGRSARWSNARWSNGRWQTAGWRDADPAERWRAVAGP
jgi:hypothetical protein